MHRFILFLLLLIVEFGTAQTRVLLVGNAKKICTDSNDSAHYIIQDSLPDQLEGFHAILLFSNARSILNSADQKKIMSYLESGKGLYIGCENWPLQSEANQLTTLLFGKEFWGNSSADTAQIDEQGASLFHNKKTISAGNSSVQFPLDYRLKTEAWIEDEPLIMSSKSFGGGLILDGGYSRFYCDEKGRSDDVWQLILNYLLEK